MSDLKSLLARLPSPPPRPHNERELDFNGEAR